jgi:spore germination cell wall hydrolase CwlJ-like protein
MKKIICIVLLCIPSMTHQFNFNGVSLRITKIPVAKHEVKCFADNLYHEARGEGHIGLIAVAFVTLNRWKSQSYPDTICGVVYQKNQFSWTRDNKLSIKDKKTWDEIYKFSEYFLNNFNEIEDITYGSKFYHAKHISPYWSRKFIKSATIGNHIFYRRD